MQTTSGDNHIYSYTGEEKNTSLEDVLYAL